MRRSENEEEGSVFLAGVIGVGLGGCAQLGQKVMGIKYTGVGFGNGKYCGVLKSFLCVLSQMSTYKVLTLQWLDPFGFVTEMSRFKSWLCFWIHMVSGAMCFPSYLRFLLFA